MHGTQALAVRVWESRAGQHERVVQALLQTLSGATVLIPSVVASGGECALGGRQVLSTVSAGDLARRDAASCSGKRRGNCPA